MFNNSTTGQNIPGSLSALSIAGGDTGLVVLGAAATVALTVGAASYVYHSYENYKEKRHRKKIEEVNNLHAKYLEKIIIYATKEIQGFPPIFKINKGEKITVESMNFTEEQIRKIGSTRPRNSDPELVLYQEAIENAIAMLKEYYFSCKNKNSINVKVISYVLYFLETKCYAFAGYDYDIAYLNAISKFIKAFASKANKTNTKNFSRLSSVYPYLLTAKQELEKHKESMSIQEVLKELFDTLIDVNKKLIRCMAMIAIDDEYWPLIENSPLDKLSQGLVRNKFTRSGFLGVIFSSEKEVHVPKSLFGKWAVMLADLYWKALNSNLRSSEDYIKSSKEIFSSPSLIRLNELKEKNHLTAEENNEKIKIKKEIQELKSTFSISKNFLTTKLDPKSEKSTPVFIPITDLKVMMERKEIVAKLAFLAHKTIISMYYSSEFIKCGKLLGEIKLRSPKHFSGIFHVLHGLCSQIYSNTLELQKDMTNIQKMNKNSMQLEKFDNLPESIDQILSFCQAAIDNSNKKIKLHIKKITNDSNSFEPTDKSVMKAIFNQTELIANIYSIDLKHEVNDSTFSDEEEDGNQKSYALSLPSVEQKKLTCDDNFENINLSSDKNLKIISKYILLMQNKKSKESNHDNSNIDKKLQVYTNIFNKLSKLKNKFNRMNNEESLQRKDKALKGLNLINKICNDTAIFIELSKEEKTKVLPHFLNSIKSHISSEKSKFLDNHTSLFKQEVNTLSQLEVFKTESRTRLISLSGLYENLCSLYDENITKTKRCFIC